MRDWIEKHPYAAVFIFAIVVGLVGSVFLGPMF